MSARTVAHNPSVGEDADTSPASLGRQTHQSCWALNVSQRLTSPLSKPARNQR
jgi:hypothetical protein